jgi:TnpA family transposase
MTWLNAINDRGMGRGAKIVSGTVRDSLHMVDVIFGLDGGDLPEIVVSDTGSYSDVVFGLLELLGISYRPALADLTDQKGWRIKGDAGYGPLNTLARCRIDLAKIRRNWEDILRVVASIYTGTVRASRSIPDSAASTVNTILDGSCEPCSSPVRNSSPIPAAGNGSASAASSRPRPSRLCSCTTLG